MTPPRGATLEARLVEAGRRAAWPPTPDLRQAVVERIEREGLAPGGAAPGAGAPIAVPARPARLSLARAIVLALVALLVLAGVAAALGFRLPGLDIVLVDHLPPAGAGLDLGSPVPVVDARAFDRPRVLVPATLPAPDAAFVIGAGSRRIVTLAYRAPSGGPTLAGSDLELTVMAVPGDTDEVFMSKLLGPATTIDRVTVGGSPGWWISGAPHDLLIRRPDGDAGVLTSRLAGDTLVFVRDGTLYRLETALGRDATVAIAESMR